MCQQIMLSLPASALEGSELHGLGGTSPRQGPGHKGSEAAEDYVHMHLRNLPTRPVHASQDDREGCPPRCL